MRTMRNQSPVNATSYYRVTYPSKRDNIPYLTHLFVTCKIPEHKRLTCEQAVMHIVPTNCRLLYWD